ncbi:hypothetical protein CLOHYLEM_06618 [[Clostridium] hylemonae DSM 15053]|uniref:Uncharacterized protein n=1 Tax=[Clostridium] hylemonae DSM 15053 TaxID=553973 RepID=C0C3F7_9FIRM|nr:hypothetical protein CLOHYLEM_06618 [[Clostridium] hylemonae DSM 15053]
MPDYIIIQPITIHYFNCIKSLAQYPVPVKIFFRFVNYFSRF